MRGRIYLENEFTIDYGTRIHLRMSTRENTLFRVEKKEETTTRDDGGQWVMEYAFKRKKGTIKAVGQLLTMVLIFFLPGQVFNNWVRPDQQRDRLDRCRQVLGQYLRLKIQK